MLDKARQRTRQRRAPPGQLSNWVLALVAGGTTALALILQRLV
jgi:hypothetical protein